MSDHALLSASGSEKWMKCWGSLALEAGIPNTSSSYADEGTAAHTLASWCLESDVSPEPEAYRGRRIDVGTRTFEVDSEMVEHVGTYVRNVLSYAEGHQLFVEQRVDYSASIGQPDAFGTSDAVILTTDGELQVHDLKYGRGVQVDAEQNSQLMLYALGAAEAFELIGDFDRVRMVIHQPRKGHLSEWACSMAELKAFATEARIAAKAATDLLAGAGPAEKSLTPGEKQCRWCRAKSTCPALAAEVRDVVHATSATPDDFEDLTVQDTTLMAAHNADHLSAAMAKVDLIEDWCKAIRAEVERRLVEGAEVPGYKLVVGRKGARSWTDATEAEAALKTFRLKTEEMYDLKLISPTTAEKLSKDKVIGPRQWSKVQTLIGQSDGKPSVAPASDKRPAITVAASVDDFDVIDDGADLV